MLPVIVAALGAMVVTKSQSQGFMPKSAYRRGSNRVPNGAPASCRPDLSGRNRVLHIDADLAVPIVVAEPGVTMESLVAATLAHGLAPKVVPEFRGITVGGAIAGGAMESSSFRHGMFHDTVSRCELLLPNGTILDCSLSQHADLFAAIGGSCGTLASITTATIECVRVCPRIALHFTWHECVERGLLQLTRMASHAPSRRNVDSLDAVALPARASLHGEGGGSSEGGLLICAASFIRSREPLPAVEWSMDGRGDDDSHEWFYEKLLRVRDSLAASMPPSAPAPAEPADDESVTSVAEPIAASCVVHMSIEDYLFRFDRGAFNMASTDVWLASWRDRVHPTKMLLAGASANQCVPSDRPQDGFLLPF